jgi:hypothetical protein
MSKPPVSYRFVVCIVLILYACVALWRLNQVPGEWFGDISIENEMVLEILQGSWPWHFILSSGPLYNYFAAGFAAVLGISYMTYKYASVAMGALGLLAVYQLGSMLHSRKIGLLAMLAMALSFWYLVWSRLGNSPQILSPFLSAMTVVALLKFQKSRHEFYLVAGGILSTMGLFSYPGLYTLPVAWLALVLWQNGPDLGRKALIRLGLAVWSLIPGILGFIHMMRTTPAKYSVQTYVGGKVPTLEDGWYPLLQTLLAYLLKALGMLHVRGDVTFRVNVPNRPHLDTISGLLFLIGLVLVSVHPKLRRIGVYLIVPMFVLSLPSISPVLPVGEIPNSGRTLGIAPFVFVLVALGLLSCAKIVRKIAGPGISKLTVILIVGMIAFLNMRSYFIEYPKNLPDNNTPFGKIIAAYIDSLPADTAVHLSACCWGAWGQPEPNGIYYVLDRKAGRENLLAHPFTTDCRMVDRRNYAVIIVSPKDIPMQEKLVQCDRNSIGTMHRDGRGQPVFYSVGLPPNAAAPSLR